MFNIDKAERCEEAEELLRNLLELKEHKDTVGKTAWYKEQKPKVWKQVRKFLEKGKENGK